MSVTCGNCTKSLGKALGSQVKHATVAEVRDCYDRTYAYRQMMAEADAFFAEYGRHDDMIGGNVVELGFLRIGDQFKLNGVRWTIESFFNGDQAMLKDEFGNDDWRYTTQLVEWIKK